MSDLRLRETEPPPARRRLDAASGSFGRTQAAKSCKIVQWRARRDSRRQALTLVAGVAAFVSGAHVTAQTSPSGGLATTEPSRVERTQAELDNNRRKTMSQTASTLSLRNLHDVFGEIDPVRRRAAIDEIFHEDAVFYEPNGAYRGRDEIDRIAGVIKATHPDFQYQPLSPPEEIGDGCRVRWVSGSPGKPPAYAGTDFIVVRDGKIAAVYLFFDKLPN